MSSKNLPPLQHLPHWTRVGRLGKSCFSRRLPVSQQLQSPHVAPLTDRGVQEAAATEETSREGRMDPRIVSLQRNILFLQQQHKETLEKLHAEIEYLRRENKELQYKLIMEPPKSSRKGLAHSQRAIRPPTQGSEAHASLYLEEQIQDTRPLQDQVLRKSFVEASEVLGSARQDPGSDMKGRLITSLQPLRIHSSPSHPPRPPTLRECEVIIRQLYNANSLQSQEITRVKALLRDIVLSKKITPENYILTKAYLIDGTCKSVEEKKFPKLSLQSFPEKTSGLSQSGVVLPALKQSFTSNIADRQRKTRALQRERLKRISLTGTKLPQRGGFNDLKNFSHK
ncbi:coiled-coil domain-containing protein 74A [Melanotaenia boesemani]|uniref:coiled-coil domain-containing protein 74A n=1 Tax=Melanotaenia boesemani TaxID=1250792 RepID=UPI001C05272F|nr:coiled-coil domain-containing protein 74A [Melanotaenia boesemani]